MTEKLTDRSRCLCCFRQESAIQGQYGTDEDATVPAGNLAQRLSRVSNAYMLVYVRESDKDMIKTNVSDEDIAEHIKHKYERELVRCRLVEYIECTPCVA